MTDSVGFLLNDTARLYRRTLDGMLRDLGMTSLQWRTVARLKREPGMRQSELADLLEVEPITLSRMIDRLADSGMVCRKPDPNDRRAWNLYLTDKTDGLIRQLEVEARRVEDLAFAGLSEDERQMLAGLVERVRANLSRKEAVDA
ncbi:MAG: transcriptional regulator [Sphingomonadales bacterium RIFCSPHIGHO2_01_FULL_65_20]|jgi:DNA-binding MarR family transcriptional regulator|uniref:MarR family winged helix-turn-helix transcriptional regulator n=1 Tax=unclassified Blastomonas TaxID=2626550 RepID=UPI000836C3FD|nr:MarR family transcriptional regulator [Blastomonas sp.]MCH2236392.1 MarR family transcriptional regulator [Blastomonas sp.]OHC94629.1 MAG: transcriptional regulator [Sphingomonadales bacterium RIFCSPHIGHO2_01_FULL_65_20]